jgi:hypothetical protein
LNIEKLRRIRKSLIMLRNEDAAAVLSAEDAIELIDAIAPITAIDLPLCAPDWLDSSPLLLDQPVANRPIEQRWAAPA